MLSSACGKKGPPLPPIVRVPAAVEALELRRVGADVYVTVPVPARNVDESVPADVARLELYALTAAVPPPPGRFLDAAVRVATVSVAPAGTPEGPAVQGARVTLRDRLGRDALDPPGDAALDGLRRFYAAVAVSPRGVPGGASPLADLPLGPGPGAPVALTATYGPARVSLTWDPVRPPPGDEGPLRYNVYRAFDDPAPAAPEGPGAPPDPLNAAPLETTVFSEDVRLDGSERCYVVRALRPAGTGIEEGEASPPACVTLAGVFPPAAPRGLSAVAAAGAISLIWEPNEEPDLAGYLILRGEHGDATLAPLAGTPIRETRFTDRSVVPGRRYVYAIVAVDGRQPVPNVSAESNRVEETAR